MTGWILYDLDTLTPRRYRDSATSFSEIPDGMGLLLTPEPSTAYIPVDNAGVIEPQLVPDIVLVQKLIPPAVIKQRVSTAIDDFIAGDSTNLKKLLVRMSILIRDRE